MEQTSNPFSFAVSSPSPSTKMRSNMEKLNLFKMTTPPWKETFRMRCSQRAKDNRSKLVDKFRGHMSNRNLIRQEFEYFKNEQGVLYSFSDQEQDDMITYFEQIEQQLLLEEEHDMIRKDLEFEENQLAAFADVGQVPDCPNCLNIPLQLHNQPNEPNKSWIHCEHCSLIAAIPASVLSNWGYFVECISKIMQMHPCPQLKLRGDKSCNDSLIAVCQHCQFVVRVFDSV